MSTQERDSRDTLEGQCLSSWENNSERSLNDPSKLNGYFNIHNPQILGVSDWPGATFVHNHQDNSEPRKGI